MIHAQPTGIRAFERFRHHYLALTGGVILAALVIIVAAVPVIGTVLGTDGETVDLLDRFAAPSAHHLLGTDELGRDVLIRLLEGGRVSLVVGTVAALTSAIVGTMVGLLAGYLGGRIDAALMRFADGVIALPLLPLLIVLAAVDLAKLGVPADLATSESGGIMRIVVIVTLVGWTTVARLVRAATLSLREETFILAARAQGAGTARILLVHILPNLTSPIIVATTLAAGTVILLESVLSFLGLGIQPPTPSWGNMLTNAQTLVFSRPALALYPGAMILTVVMALNFLGDGLREALDPRSQPR